MDGPKPVFDFSPPQDQSFRQFLKRNGRDRFLSTTMPRPHAVPPPLPPLPRLRYSIVSMYVGLIGKFPSILTAIFDFINVSLVCCHQVGHLPFLLPPPSLSPPT